MPVTALDPGTALLVVDLQKGIATALPPPQWGSVVDCNVALLEAFRAKRLPIVIITTDGFAPGRTDRSSHFDAPEGFADPIDGLDPQPEDILVVKQTWGAFARSDLEAQLRARGVSQVVVTGVATSFGVESTARQAYEAGFNVTLAVDAMADPSAASHQHCIAAIFPRLGETGFAADIIRLLLSTRAQASA